MIALNVLSPHTQRKKYSYFRSIALFMIFKNSQIDHINKLYRQMKTKRDLLNILNLIKSWTSKEGSPEIGFNQLNYYISNESLGKRYKQFEISKKSGGVRVINSPVLGLKVIQRCLNHLLSIVFKTHDAAFGFVIGKSIVDNANIHTNNTFVYNIDLKDFFPSINQARIWGRLQYPPFNLNKKCQRLDLANVIATLCCCQQLQKANEKPISVLAQGAPTSPILSNIIAFRLDFYLSAVAKRFGAHYSRYADDITFSSMNNIYTERHEFIQEVERIIKAESFEINPVKTRLQKDGYRKEVTGIVVNEKPNVRKKYIKDIRKWIYLWETYGFEKAELLFQKDYGKEKKSLVMYPVLLGKIEFLKMVRGEKDSLSNKLEIRLNHLSKGTALKKEKKIRGVKVPLEHKPKIVVKHLKKFTKNDSDLKFSTHIWDIYDKSIDLFLEGVDKEFTEFSRDLNSLKPTLNAKIFSFLLRTDVSESGWGEHRIKFGWSSPELKTLYDNPVKRYSYPGDVVIPEEYRLIVEGKSIQKFSQIIDLFKSEIEIREENNQLRKLLIKKFDAHLSSFNYPIFENIEGVSFFTDVQTLSSALDLVFQSFKNRPQYPSLKFSIVRLEDYSVELRLTQVGSFSSFKSKDDLKFRLDGGDFGTLAGKLKNLCDWSIESKFNDGCFRINLLVSDMNIDRLYPIDDCEGFTYIFRFYR